jgi:predicted DNA-binding protein (UPF0251 family)
MTDLSISHPSDALSKPVSVKRVRIPEAIRQAIELLASGECTTQKAAASRVGISQEHLSRMLQRDHIRVFMARAASKTIAGAALRASRRYVELVDANSEHVSAQVCERILTSEGHLKSDAAQLTVNVDVKPGFVIDISPAPLLQHEPQQQAKALTKQDDVPSEE